jgi:DNA-binding HxlR family transcriptional regulator
MKRRCESLCPKFQAAMEILAKPWNGLLLTALETDASAQGEHAHRFSELAERLSPIGDRMLSARLKELEKKGLVERRVHAGPPVRVEYMLTEAGRGFHEVAEAIGVWGQKLLLPAGAKGGVCSTTNPQGAQCRPARRSS